MRQEMGLPKGTSFRLALCAIGLLLAGELGLSWMGFGSPLLYRASADPLDLGQYEPVPNQNVMRLGRQTRINSLGTRGREIERQSKQGAYRILVLGDSVTNGGTLVNDAETYPAQLESKLREAGCPAEVLNASAGGWSVFNEAGWLRAHGVHGSQMLIWTINTSDLTQAHQDSVLGVHPSVPDEKPLLATEEVVIRYVLPRLRLAPEIADPGANAGRFDSALPIDIVRELSAWQRKLNARNVTLRVVLWDMPYSAEGDLAAARERFLGAARQSGLTIWLVPRFDARQEVRLMRDDIHPNEAGNRWLAGWVSPRVLPFCR